MEQNNNWVFLRGLTRGNIHWGPFPEIFQSRDSKIQMEFIEIPGNGLKNLERSPISSFNAIHLLRKNCHFSRNKLSFNLCGISLGGMIALKWAQLYPEEIQSVSIINSSLRQLSPISKRLIPRNYLKILGALFNSNAADQERLILEITSNHFKETNQETTQETKKFISTFAEFSAAHPISRINFVRQLLLASHITINTTNNTPCFQNIPFKVISSKQDRLVDSSCSKRIAEAFACKSYIHPTAGHDLPLDDPNWLCDVLLV
jgi:pimeloyl-ACP methyl ester carboxylesterase